MPPVDLLAFCADRERLRLTCVLPPSQRAGDVLWVPDDWGHAVLNLLPSVGFASEFATARGCSTASAT